MSIMSITDMLMEMAEMEIRQEKEEVIV